jgi:hypothetical protein
MIGLRPILRQRDPVHTVSRAVRTAIGSSTLIFLIAGVAAAEAIAPEQDESVLLNPSI